MTIRCAALALSVSVFMWGCGSGSDDLPGAALNLSGQAPGDDGATPGAGVDSDGTDAADGTSSADGTDAVDGADSSPNPVDGTDGIAADGADGLNAADGVDAEVGTDGVDLTDGVDGVDLTDGTDGAALTDGSDGLDATDAVDGTDGLDATDAVDGTDGIDATDAVDGTDGTPLECVSNKDCSDGDPCTKDRCNLFVGVCSWEPIAGCEPEPECTKASDCQDDNPCTADACVNGSCAYTDTACECETKADCDDDDPCTTDACVQATCISTPIPGCGECVTVFAADFEAEGSLTGWQEYSGSTENAWQRVTKRHVSGEHSLYMGNPSVWNYVNKDDNLPFILLETVEGIRTPKIAFPSGAGSLVLRAKVWLDIEDCIGQSANSYDQFDITLEKPAGAYTSVWDKCDMSEPWQQWRNIEVDLGNWKGQTVDGLWLYFESGNGAQNETEGIFVDDLIIEMCPE